MGQHEPVPNARLVTWNHKPGFCSWAILRRPFPGSNGPHRSAPRLPLVTTVLRGNLFPPLRGPLETGFMGQHEPVPNARLVTWNHKPGFCSWAILGRPFPGSNGPRRAAPRLPLVTTVLRGNLFWPLRGPLETVFIPRKRLVVGLLLVATVPTAQRPAYPWLPRSSVVTSSRRSAALLKPGLSPASGWS
jgi:hypothetical protein